MKQSCFWEAITSVSLETGCLCTCWRIALVPVSTEGSFGCKNKNSTNLFQNSNLGFRRPYWWQSRRGWSCVDFKKIKRGKAAGRGFTLCKNKGRGLMWKLRLPAWSFWQLPQEPYCLPAFRLRSSTCPRERCIPREGLVRRHPQLHKLSSKSTTDNGKKAVVHRAFLEQLSCTRAVASTHQATPLLAWMRCYTWFLLCLFLTLLP